MAKQGVIRKGAITKGKIAKAAAELFDAKGYSGAGLTDILVQAGVPKGSIYFHFPGGKEEIAAEAINIAGKDIQEFLDGALTKSKHPSEAINLVIGVFKARLVEAEFRSGCPVSAVGLELSGTQSLALDACSAAFSAWIKTLEFYLKNYVAEEQAAKLADAVFCLIQGALILSRVTGDLEHLSNAEVYSGKLLRDALSKQV